ncbi:uncharacterized protein LOC130762211 isoform X1 [Actinidia eriantha]|uniref:uncharacterized protein LOC130762211 isoform X1 n=1 Tax=Actinidia eriantha TaxID=165200 RepID=UPI00258FA90F|nr:uncharacterized protein LOC130762211 isoform X1 [Actinidia eriantha]
MTTIEKLFVQIFERKNSIIQQVKQQTDLYNQHLASKLLIDGITPPPWLWNPNKFNSEILDPKELKKEELISELLLPHPQPVVLYPVNHCYLYDKPSIIGDNGELSEGLFMENHAPNEGFNTGDRPTTVPGCHDNDIGRTLDCVHELDLRANSPQRQAEVKISNYTAPDQSLVRLQRSKSRQKALELRKTAEKAASKSWFIDENDIGISSRGIKPSRIASQQVDRDLAEISDVISDNGAVRLAKEECLKGTNIYCGRITRSISSCNLSSRDSKHLELLNASDIDKDFGVRMTRSQSNCPGGVSKPVYSSNTASQRVAQSKSGASKKFLLAKSLKRLEGFIHQKVSHGEVIPHCPDIDAPINKEAKADYITETEPVSDGSVETLAACSKPNFDAAGLSLGLEVFVSRPPSDCSMSVKPKTLDFADVEECSLKETSSNPMMEKEMLDISSGKRCRTSVKSATSLDKVTFHSRKSLEEQSLDQEVSIKTVETWREECVQVDEEESKSNTNKNRKNVEDKSEAVLEIQRPPVSHEEDAALSNVGHAEGLKSSPKLQVKEGGLGSFGRDRSETTPSAFKNQQLGPSLVSSMTKHSTEDQVSACSLLKRNSRMGEYGLLECGSIGSLHSEDKNFSSSRVIDQLLEKSSLPGRRLRSAIEDSWPQFKKRKIEGQQTKFFSASPSFRGKEIHSIGGHTTNGYLKSQRDNLGSILQFQCFAVSHEGDVAQSRAGKYPKVKMQQNVSYQSTLGIKPLSELQLEKGELGSEWRNKKSTNTPSAFKHGKLGRSVVSSLTNEEAGDSPGCSINNMGSADTIYTTRSDEQYYKNLLHSENNVAIENKGDLAYAKSIMQKIKPHFEKDCLYSYCSSVSPQNKHLASVGLDQTIPEFEGFIVDAEENGQPHIVEDAISFDKFDLPSTTIERASVLEQLCRSATLHTPLSQFSTTFKLHGTPDLYQSLPNELLEHVDLRNTLYLTDEGGNQL